MKNEIYERAIELSKKPYSIEISRSKTTDGQDIYLAKNIELEGCMAQGDSIDDALNNLFNATVDYISSLIEDGLDIPLPGNKKTFTSDPSTYNKIIFNQNPTQKENAINENSYKYSIEIHN